MIQRSGNQYPAILGELKESVVHATKIYRIGKANRIKKSMQGHFLNKSI